MRHCWYTELLMLSCECAMSVRLWILFPFQSHDEEGIILSSRRCFSLILKMDIWCLQLANKQHTHCCCSLNAAPPHPDDRPFYAFIADCQIANIITLFLQRPSLQKIIKSAIYGLFVCNNGDLVTTFALHHDNKCLQLIIMSKF